MERVAKVLRNGSGGGSSFVRSLADCWPQTAKVANDDDDNDDAKDDDDDDDDDERPPGRRPNASMQPRMDTVMWTLV